MSHLLPEHPSLTHPRTGAPVRALGRRRDGRLIWPAIGASPDNPPAPPTPPAPPADPPAPPAPPVPPVPTPPPAPPAPPTPPQPDPEPETRDESKLPKWARDELAATRREAAARRVSERTATVGMRAYAVAGQHNVNPAALLGSTEWATRAVQLDPAAADFGEQLAAAIKATAEAAPWVVAQAGPGRSGGELNNGQPPRERAASIDAAVAARYGGTT